MTESKGNMGNREILESIRTLAGKQLSDDLYIVDCSVDSVDRDKLQCECTPIGGDFKTGLSGVLLMPENSDGLVVFPAVGSSVKVLYSTRTDPFVIAYTEIDEAEFYVADPGGGNPTKWNIKAGQITMNDGSFGGLAKLAALTTKLNNLENLVNSLITLYNSHIHPGGTISGSTGPTVSIEPTTLTPTIQADIENDKVKHGV